MSRNALRKEIYSEIISIPIFSPHKNDTIKLKKSVAAEAAKLLAEYQENIANRKLRNPTDFYYKALKNATIQFRKLPEWFQFAQIEEDLANKRPIARKLCWFYSPKHLRNLILFKMLSLLTAEGISKNKAFEVIHALAKYITLKGKEIDAESTRQHIRRVSNFYTNVYPELESLSSRERFNEIQAKLDEHIRVALLPRHTYNHDLLLAVTRNTNVKPHEIMNDLCFFRGAKQGISYLWCVYLMARQNR